MKNEGKSLEVGQVVNVPMTSTGPARITITHVGMMAEVNGVEQEPVPGTKFWRSVGSLSGRPINHSQITPVAIGRDATGKLRAILWWNYRWLGHHHRIIEHSRDWEMEDGSELSAELTAIADEALANR